MGDLKDPGGYGAEQGWNPLIGDPVQAAIFQAEHEGGSPSHAIGKPNQDIMAEATKAQTESARSMEEIAGELWGTGAGLRPQLEGSYEELLAGGLTGQDSPLYQAIAPSVGAQYDVASRNIAEAGGGQGAQNLVSEGRAEGLSDLMAKSSLDDYSKLFGVAFGQPGTALQGHHGAGNIWGNVGMQGAQQQQMFNQTMGGIGEGLGMMFSGGSGGGGQSLSGPSMTTDYRGRNVVVA